MWGRKILGSRVPAVRRRSRANYQNFLAQNYFPVTRGSRKNFPDRTDSQRESVKKFPRPRRPRKKFPRPRCVSYAEDYWTPPHPPSPGEMGSRPPNPRPAAVRECKRVGQIAIRSPPVWPYARHTFCNSGKFRLFGDRVPAPLRVLGPPWGGPMGPLLRRTHGKKIECVCMPGTLFVRPKTPTLLQNFLSTDPHARYTFRKGAKKFHP